MAKKKNKYYVRPDGLHEAIRTINGKRVAFRGRTDAEVERKMIEYQAKLAAGKTFKEVADAWEGEHFPTVAPNTLRSYRPALKRAVEWFGSDLIREISPPDIKEFIVDFAGKGRAKKTVTTQLQICNMICSWAVERGEMDVNPCTCVSIPKGLKKSHRDAASEADEAIVKASPHIWLFPYFILYTGVRKGEALAIQGRDIDRKNNVIHVSKSVYHENKKPFIKAPKSDAGVRDVPLLLPLLSHLPKGLKPDQYLFSCNGGEDAAGRKRVQEAVDELRPLHRHYLHRPPAPAQLRQHDPRRRSGSKGSAGAARSRDRRHDTGHLHPHQRLPQRKNCGSSECKTGRRITLCRFPPLTVYFLCRTSAI